MFKTPAQKEWQRILKEEEKFLKLNIEKKPSKFNDFIADKVPDKLQDTLNLAFSKSFSLIFDKGIGIIEKSYNKDEIEFKHKLNSYAYSIKQDRKRAKAFDKEANKSENVNVLFSGVKGIGLGILGIGLPDIPIFIATVLKGIYEISMQYGFDYESEEERYFILNIIATALSYGENSVQGNKELNHYITSPTLPQNYNRDEKLDIVCNVLSTELLYMKFLQGIPIVGVVGGISDALFVKKILSYARLKYKRRFLQINGKKVSFE